MEKSEQTKKVGFEGFVAKALRPPRKSILDTSICQHLVLSISAAPLKSIYHVTQAAFLLALEQAEKVGINLEELEVLRTVNLAFKNALKQPHTDYIPLSPWSSEQIRHDYHSIIWGFRENEENYEKFISSWLRDSRQFYQQSAMPLRWRNEIDGIKSTLESIQEEASNIVEKIRRLEKKLDGKMSNPTTKLEKKLETLRNRLVDLKDEEKDVFIKSFYMVSKYLTPDSFFHLQNQYLNWALPRSQTLFAKLSSYVNPDTYAKILELHMKKGEAESESPMGPNE